jgi:hypothetical protein
LIPGRPKTVRSRAWLLPDLLFVFCCTALLIGPLFRVKYEDRWASIESTFISDARFLAAHWPHPLWQPLWYGGTRFDYVYPPVLRYGTALLTNFFVPVKAYHVFVALMFSFGIAGVYFLVRVMGRSRLQSWLSAAACALLSPSFLFIPEIRYDAIDLLPLRLGVLIRYGEGPHISALSLLPFALGFAFLGLQRHRNRSIVLAAVFSALVALTNFYGATALAIFYPILVWSLWVTNRDRAIWLRALAIPALAYGLTAFWLTPGYFKITLYNMRYVSQPGNRYSVLLAVFAMLLFGVVSIRTFARKPQLAYLIFTSGSLLFFTLNVLGHHYFNFRVIGEPHRLIPEMDMAMLLAGIELLRRLWLRPFASPVALRLARTAVILTAVSAVWPLVRFLPHAWEMYPREIDFHKRVEYRISGWISEHMPDSRTFVMGSTRFWWDAWHDNTEVGGGSDQGLINPNPSAAAWEITLGPDPEPSVLWLQSLGADAIVVSDEHSQDAYHDFHAPLKFAGVLPVLLDDQEGNVIYRVPRRYPGLARVVETERSRAAKPMDPATNLTLLRAYSDMVEKGPDMPVTTHWNGPDSISIHTSIEAGQSLLVQVTYDPAWRAWSGKSELPIRRDAMGFMAIDAPAGTRDVILVFETPLENKVGYAVTAATMLICLCLGVVAARAPADPE